MIYLGSHVSFKAPNYFKGAIEEALSYGANACMIYTGPPSNTRRVDVSKLKIEEAKDYMAEHNFSIDRVIAGGKKEGLLIKKGEIIEKIPQEQIVARLKEEIDKF